MTQTVVLDASAAVLLLIDPGSAGEHVAARLDGASVVAPDLLPYEVSNVLRRHRNAGRLSETVASRDQQIGELLKNLDTVSGTLAERDEDIIALMRDSRVLFRALVQRREAIHNLLVSTSRLSRELTLLVSQSRADLKPALTHLQNVVAVLNKNEDNLDNSLRLMAPFYRVFANTLGTGPWFDTWIQNLPPVPEVAQ